MSDFKKVAIEVSGDDSSIKIGSGMWIDAGMDRMGKLRILRCLLTCVHSQLVKTMLNDLISDILKAQPQ